MDAKRGWRLAGLIFVVGTLSACGSSTAPQVSDGGGGGSGPVDPGDIAGNTFMAIVPPGSNGNSAGGVGAPIPGVPVVSYPDNFRDQLDMYGNLAYAKQGLKSDTCTPPKNIDEHQKQSDQACNYFKAAPLTLSDADAVSRRELTAPNGKTVTIRRDGWGVPYVDGEDRSAAQYGLGFAAAQDRLWLFDLLRKVGRGRASEMLGPSPTTYELDLEFGAPAGYSEDELTQIVNAAVDKMGPTLGPLFLNDTEMFVAGMNAYIDGLLGADALETPPEYATLALGLDLIKFPPAPFTVNDIVANAVLIQSALGFGGGGEAVNLKLLQQLDPTLGPGSMQIAQGACETWRDLRHATDADTPVTASGTFATQSPPSVDESCPQNLPAGTAIWDAGSFQGFTLQTHGAGLPLEAPIPGEPGGGLGAAKSAGGLNLLGRLSWLTAMNAPADATVIPFKREQPKALVLSDNPGGSLHALLNRLGLPLTTSNFIAVAANQTQSGHPIIVAGPQTGYFDPQLLWEAAVVSHGDTQFELAARGISTVNLPYIVIGHGLDFAWSPTSAGSDFTDTRVSTMCNMDASPASREDADEDGFPDADGYLYKGNCVRFYKRVDEWTAQPTVASVALGGQPFPETVKRYVLRTHYGPVFGTATVNGEPVAISTQRSTFFADVDTAAPFALLTTTGAPMTHTRFKQLFNSMTATFNWLYADSKDIAYIQSGLYPKRHPDQHPELPVWGDGRFEWVVDQNLPMAFFDTYGGDGNTDGRPFPSRAVPEAQNSSNPGYFEWPGFLSLAAHIQDTNPPQGYLANWNNSGARGWWAADSNGTYGPTHRVRMLSERLKAFKASGRKHTLATMIEIMGDAAYTDLRGQDLLPLLIELMEQDSLTADQAQVVVLMTQWMAAGSNNWISDTPGLGSMRRDRDADGVYDFRAQVVLMDAWYQHLMETVTPQLAEIAGSGVSTLTSRYDAPRAQGSAFQEGWFQHMIRMLQTVLDKPGHETYRALKCAGTGDPADCRAAVLTALNDALSDLGGVSNMANWDGSQIPNAKGSDGAVVEDYDAVEHTAFSLLPVPPIHWINRPTFQQAVEITQDRYGE
jgi:acyl-homoserine lactone acylase PvdQ